MTQSQRSSTRSPRMKISLHTLLKQKKARRRGNNSPSVRSPRLVICDANDLFAFVAPMENAKREKPPTCNCPRKSNPRESANAGAASSSARFNGSLREMCIYIGSTGTCIRNIPSMGCVILVLRLCGKAAAAAADRVIESYADGITCEFSSIFCL